MVFYDDSDRINTAGDYFSLFRMLGMQRGAMRQRARYSAPRRVLGASGGSVVYRRDFFDAVGLYDEDFFILHEDTDINLRALIAGKKCLYVPSAVVRHKVGSSVGRQPSARILMLSSRNQGVVIGKDVPIGLIPRPTRDDLRAPKGHVPAQAVELACHSDAFSLACLVE